jgi:hypothetical protein
MQSATIQITSQKNPPNQTALPPVSGQKNNPPDVKTRPRQQIYGLSFDFDGCLCNYQYQRARYAPHNTDDEAFFIGNTNLFKHIFTSNKQHQFNHTRVLIGSARQSKSMEDGNTGNDQSRACFPKMKTVLKHLRSKINSCTFDDFLMADLYNDLLPGQSFKQALSTEFKGEHPKVITDESKITLLYAQIHRLASQHPEADITFDFYDDRTDILEKLTRHFIMYRKQLPQNVTLRLYQFGGDDIHNKLTLPGSGPIDFNYQQTIKQWVVNTKKDITIPDYIKYPTDTAFPLSNTKFQDDKTESATQKYQREIAVYIQKQTIKKTKNEQSFFACCLSNLAPIKLEAAKKLMQQLNHEASEKFTPAEITIIDSSSLLTNIKNYLISMNGYNQLKEGVLRRGLPLTEEDDLAKLKLDQTDMNTAIATITQPLVTQAMATQTFTKK